MKKFAFTLLSLTIFFMLSPPFSKTQAASLSFEPEKVEISSNQTFEIKINVTSETETIVGVDAVVNFDPNYLEYKEVKQGSFFPTVSSRADENKIYLFALVNSLQEAKNGSGTIASLSFNASKEGSLNLGFDCSKDSVSESNIIKNDENATDIIVCTDNGKAEINILASTGNDPTPTSSQGAGLTVTPTISQALANITPTTNPSPTITPSVLPRTGGDEGMSPAPTREMSMPRAGVMDNLFIMLAIGALAIVSGSAILFR